MANLYETAEKKEKVILFSVCTGDNRECDESLSELEELVKTAGAESVGKLIQNLERPVSGTYLGTGKIEELEQMVCSLGADAVVCDDELSPVQMKNLEDELSVKVLDRTMVILDIFAQRASTKEGKLQVELAELKYSLTRLVGGRSALSRQGGGIGTRGPGEKKLEQDRRIVRDRVSQLEKELEEVVKNRDTIRASRKKNAYQQVAIVGYTNAGKSTLLNRLSDANVLEEDKLFATLDPTTRGVVFDDGQTVMLTDTVGFIRKLPHHLVEAFKSTLEEAKYADVILHVVDASSEDLARHVEVVYETLERLGIGDKPIITVFNKQDMVSDKSAAQKDLKAKKTVKASVGIGEGLDEIKNAIAEVLKESRVYVEKLIAYNDAGKIDRIRKKGQLVSEEYVEDGIVVKAYIDRETYAVLGF